MRLQLFFFGDSPRFLARLSELIRGFAGICLPVLTRRVWSGSGGTGHLGGNGTDNPGQPPCRIGIMKVAMLGLGQARQQIGFSTGFPSVFPGSFVMNFSESLT
jgi:hypothetical protein